MEKLSKTEQYLLEQIEDDINFFSQNSISDLEKRFFVSKGVILRLVKKCGFSKLRSMQTYYAQKEAISSIMSVTNDYMKEEALDDVLSNTSSMNISSIYETNKTISMSMVENIVKEINKRDKHIMLFALGNSYLSLNYFSLLLKRIGIMCSLHNSVGGFLTELQFLDKKNTIIFVLSNHIKSKEILHIIKSITEQELVLMTNVETKFNHNRKITRINYATRVSSENYFPIVGVQTSQMHTIDIFFNTIIKNDPTYLAKFKDVNEAILDWNKK